MVQYCVSVTVTLSTVVITDAASEDDAIDKVRNAYLTGDIELDSSDFIDCVVICIEDQYDADGEEQHIK